MQRRGRREAATGADQLVTWLPRPGTVVEIGIGGSDRSWASRVEHREGTTLVVVAPTRARGEAIVPDPGTEVRLGWPTDMGYLEVVGALTGTMVDVVLTWEVAARRVRRRQRRAAFRLPVALPVVIADGTVASEGVTCDLSETGVRCELPRREAPAEGATIWVTIGLRGEPPLTTRARVVRFQDAGEPGRVQVGLAFESDEGGDRGDRLRRFVFAEQLERRAAAR